MGQLSHYGSWYKLYSLCGHKGYDFFTPFGVMRCTPFLSTYKFSKLTPLNFIEKTGWENFIKDHSNFPLVDHFVNSDNLFPGWCTDNIRREFMLHFIGKKGLIFQKHVLPCPEASVQNLCKGLTKKSVIENYRIPQKRPVLTPLSVKPIKLHRSICCPWLKLPGSFAHHVRLWDA